MGYLKFVYVFCSRRSNNSYNPKVIYMVLATLKNPVEVVLCMYFEFFQQ